MHTRPLRPVEDYQSRTYKGAATAVVKNDEDVLVQAPTGAGKSAMMARTARMLAKNGKKVLILTHRKTLFKQLGGNPQRSKQKEQEGEIRWWANMEPGTIAEEGLGGVNQEPDVVLGMVETVGNRLDQLDDYDVVMIDETHHASKESDERDDKGSYAKIIDAMPNAKVVGFTATTFRGDEDELHPRLQGAHREVVSIEEARASGRIVPARTIIGKAKLADGKTPADYARDELEGRTNGKSASSLIKAQRDEAFYQQGVEDWDRLVDRKPTIVFVDSVEEVERMTRRFEKAYGEGIAVGVHGGKHKTNDADIEAYAEGRAKVLVACQMIGEGFDVPATDAVMSFNASLSRQEMNQIVGRPVRAADGKEEGLFFDYGTASIKHGLIEHQHELQNIDALSAAGSKAAASRAVGRAAPVSHGDWSVVPGEKRSLFFKAGPKGYTLYELDQRAEKEMGRRTKDSVSRLLPVKDEDGKSRPVSMEALSKTIADHVRAEAPHYTRRGGLQTPEYREECRGLLNHWSGTFAVLDRYDDKDEAAMRRREMVRDDLNGVAKGGCDSRLVKKAVEAAKNPVAMLRETLGLAGAAFEVCAESEKLSLGARAEARALGVEFTPERLKELKAAELHKEAKATRAIIAGMTKETSDVGMARVLSNIDEPMEKGIDGVERMDREQKAKKRAR